MNPSESLRRIAATLEQYDPALAKEARSLAAAVDPGSPVAWEAGVKIIEDGEAHYKKWFAKHYDKVLAGPGEAKKQLERMRKSGVGTTTTPYIVLEHFVRPLRELASQAEMMAEGFASKVGLPGEK
jgi:hypothetical protein